MSQSGPSGFRKFFSRKVDEDKVEEEILSMVEEGHEQGLIEEGERWSLSTTSLSSETKKRRIS